MSYKSLRTYGIICVAFCFMAFQSPSQAVEEIKNRTVPVNSCSIENTAFVPGEKIVYKIYYNWNFIWLAAGEVVFEVSEEGDQYHLSAEGRTYKSYEWFYKIKDYYDTYVDKETLLPSLSIRDINEGKYRLYDEISFDQRKRKAVSLRGRSKEEAKIQRYDIEPCMHDLLSILYYTRNLDFSNFKEGDIIPIKLFMDEETWPLNLEFRGRDDNKKIKGNGRFKTIKFGPEVIEGYYFKKDAEMNVWVSDDENKIPLLIESPVSVGSIKAVIKEYNGLRHDLGAEVEKK